MNTPPKSLAIAGISGFLMIAAVAACLVYFKYLPSITTINLPLHSTIETLGGMSALLIAMVLYHQQTLLSSPVFFPAATGFACMGVLDTFHAMCMPGNAFVFLHSMASLAGGFFFAWICLPDKILARYTKEQQWFAGISIILSSSIGFRALFFPDNVPVIIQMYDGAFTSTAILINTLSSLFFLASVPAFFFRYRISGNSNLLVFMAIATLFGLAEMIFQYSETWDTVWWVWHMLRFTALIMTLTFVVKCYIELSRNLLDPGGDTDVTPKNEQDPWK